MCTLAFFATMAIRQWSNRPRQKVLARAAAYRKIAHIAAENGGDVPSFYPHYGVAGDKAYSSRGNRAYLRKHRTKAVIPEKKDQDANRKKKGSRGGRASSHDVELYKERNTVERAINKMKARRGIATRYDRTPGSYLAGLHVRASVIWIKGPNASRPSITTKYAP